MANRKSNKQVKMLIQAKTGCVWINDWKQGSSTLLRPRYEGGVIVSVYSTNLGTISLDANGNRLAVAKG